MRILVIAEYTLTVIKPATYATLDVAQKMGGEIHMVIIGDHAHENCQPLSALSAITKLLTVNTEPGLALTAEHIVAIVNPLVKNYDAILAPATTFGKNFMPRLAAVNDVGQISDITAVISPDTFVRPIYAGNILQTVQSLDALKFITVRPSAFDMRVPDLTDSPAGTPIVEIILAPVVLSHSAKVTQFHQTKLDRPELTAARVVVSGGRGIGSAENFRLLDQLALKLNAAVGASRVAVDSGFVPNDYQVGQTGKVVSPELYIAVGISGAIQHLAGMRDSKIIVAINKDPEAPIFEVANYGLVGDLFDILPELTTKL